MKRILFISLYAATLLVPAALYIGKFGWGSTPYSLSMLLGTIAFTIFVNQFFLAAKPRLAVEALGTKGLISFHGTMAVLGLVVAAFHRMLKVGLLEGTQPAEGGDSAWNALLYGVGFSDATVQAVFGQIALILFLIAVLLAAFLMANTFWMKMPVFKRFKDGVYGALKLTYPRMREVHNLVVIATALILVHVLLASTSSFAANPLGASWMILWAALGFGTYVRYRLAGRKAPAKAKS